VSLRGGTDQVQLADDVADDEMLYQIEPYLT
jgi:hypothetical protein